MLLPRIGRKCYVVIDQFEKFYAVPVTIIPFKQADLFPIVRVNTKGFAVRWRVTQYDKGTGRKTYESYDDFFFKNRWSLFTNEKRAQRLARKLNGYG